MCRRYIQCTSFWEVSPKLYTKLYSSSNELSNYWISPSIGICRYKNFKKLTSWWNGRNYREKIGLGQGSSPPSNSTKWHGLLSYHLVGKSYTTESKSTCFPELATGLNSCAQDPFPPHVALNSVWKRNWSVANTYRNISCVLKLICVSFKDKI